MGLSGFVLFKSLCPSCSWISVSFSRLGNFSAIIFSDTFVISSFSSPSGILVIRMLVCLSMLVCEDYSRCLLNCCYFFSFSFCCSDWVISIIFCLPDHLCILLYHSVCYLFFLMCFLFQLLHHSLLTGYFLIFSNYLLKYSVYSNPFT